MARTASAMLDSFVVQFDDTRANGLIYLNDRYREMVVDAHWFQKTASLGVTVVNQTDYAVTSGIEDIRSLYIAGTRYSPVSMEDMASLTDLASDVDGPVFSQAFDSTGAVFVRLWPVPDAAGQAITAYSDGQPVALTDSTGAAGTPSIPEDLHRYLYDGLVSDGYLYADERPDMAQVHAQLFDAGKVLLRKRRNSRFGSTATTLNVSTR